MTSLPPLAEVAELGRQLRVDSIRCSTRAGSGHPTSSMSAADLMAVLMARHLRYDFDHPDDPRNDHLIFSKGHASPLVYSMFRAAGAIDEDELMTFRRFGSRLQGHPTPLLPWVDVATGSLGQGLPIGVGVALAGRYLDRLPYHVWVLCGDSEMAEGSIWEALDKAGLLGLDNLTVMIDVNRLGQRGPTELQWDLEAYARRVEAFGCTPRVIDGHDLEQIDAALEGARLNDTGRPVVVVARTVKGSGFSEIEDREGWHGKVLPPDMADRAIAELGGVRNLRVTVNPPIGEPPGPAAPAGVIELPRYELGAMVATRKAFGDSLAALAADPKVVAFDAEVGNSTHLEEFQKVAPDRYFELFIAEQQMVAATVGASVRGYRAYCATFGAFFSRAFDFVRMAAISRAEIKLVGSHAGVEIGQDGPSQMALEDFAAMRAVEGSTCLYPGTANATAALTLAMKDLDGVVYMRTTRGAYPELYEPGTGFPVGGSKTVRQSAQDRVTLVGAGVTLHNCLAAAERLAGEGIAARVIDLYSVKPVDAAGLRAAAAATGDTLVVVEDHYPQGGLGAAVMEALAGDPRPPRVIHLAVRGLPGSGEPAELMAAAGIGPDQIVETVHGLLSGS